MSSPLKTAYQQFIHKSRYARFDESLGRREDWEETVDRYVQFLMNKQADKLEAEITQDIQLELYNAIYNLEIMPSMRALMTAGTALERDNMAGFNCSYVAIEDPRAFDEVLYILTCGTGVGFSVERQFINSLPMVDYSPNFEGAVHTGINDHLTEYYKKLSYFPGVPEEELSTYYRENNTIYVADSKYGWASALRILIMELYQGNFKIKWNTDEIRPAGARLKVFGGRASGPKPLIEIFRFCKEIFKKAQGRKLNSLECHDILCKIGEIVVVGGVRRSALISLSNLSDIRMRDSKHGQWWENEPQRALANNSACYTEMPDMNAFMQEWKALFDSQSGERGIFNRVAAKDKARENGRRDPNWEFGTNPCSEIILRSMQCCNLTEVVVRPDDTLETLKRKIKLATILGTFQASLTDFIYLRPEWQYNCDDEALLGVSLTGIMDHPFLSAQVLEHKGFEDPIGGPITLRGVLEKLKEKAVETNKKWSEYLGINAATAITCIKPSGTVSQLVDCASGIHPRHSKFYIRTVRGDKKDPLSLFLMDTGVAHEDAIGKEESTTVFSFPVKVPENAITRDNLSAIEHLELWLVYAKHWCEHKPSVTINIRDHEWLEVGAFVYKNFKHMSGISFLPFSEHTYQQAPYQEVEEEDYQRLLDNTPVDLDWDEMLNYEKEDHTVGSQELACSSGFCEIS